MIDSTNDGRFYFLPPLLPETYSPAIRVYRGVIRPCYVNPSLLGEGIVYSEGSQAVCKRSRELQGIRAALELMGKVWAGILKSKMPCDMKRQMDIASDLTERPNAALSYIKESGVLGTKGGLKYATDYYRNVMALAYWGALFKLRNRMKKAGKLTDSPGGWAYNEAANLMNALCRESCPDTVGWGHVDFTGNALKGLIDRALLDPKIVR